MGASREASSPNPDLIGAWSRPRASLYELQPGPARVQLVPDAIEEPGAPSKDRRPRGYIGLQAHHPGSECPAPKPASSAPCSPCRGRRPGVASDTASTRPYAFVDNLIMLCMAGAMDVAGCGGDRWTSASPSRPVEEPGLPVDVAVLPTLARIHFARLRPGEGVQFLAHPRAHPDRSVGPPRIRPESQARIARVARGTDAAGWKRTIAAIKADLKRMDRLLAHPGIDIFAPAPFANNKSVVRCAFLALGHNCYHLGEFAILRQVMQLWRRRRRPAPEYGAAGDAEHVVRHRR
jgi:hypothetical protein